MKTPKDVIIVGAGVMGLSLAWRLAQKGVNVTLLEREKCGAGASLAALGALMPYNPSRQDKWPQIQQESLWMYPQFATELMLETGIDVHYKRLGRLHPIQSEHQLKKLTEDAQKAIELWPNTGHQPIQQILNQEEAQKIAPELECGRYGALLCRATAAVSVNYLIAALRAACLKAGVDLRENCDVQPFVDTHSSLTPQKEAIQIHQLRTSHGVLAVKGDVVIASGAWSGGLVETGKIPVGPLKGQALLVKCEGLKLKHLVRGLGLYIIPQAGSHFLIGATKEKEAEFNIETTIDAEDILIEKAAKLIPMLAEGKIMRQWAGLRPQSKIKDPIEGLVEGYRNVYTITGHGGIGICMAPVMAKRMTSLLLNAQ